VPILVQQCRGNIYYKPCVLYREILEAGSRASIMDHKAEECTIDNFDLKLKCTLGLLTCTAMTEPANLQAR
jgi:hypothetical protein